MYYHYECQTGNGCIIAMNVKRERDVLSLCMSKGKRMYYHYECQKGERDVLPL